MVSKKVKGNLEEVDGNAFSLLGHFTKLALEQGFDKEWVYGITDEAMEDDYYHLITTLADNMEEEG